MSYRDEAAQMLKQHEGLRLKMYQCTEGYNTIGYGFNLDANEIPQEVADILLDQEIQKTIYYCENYPYWRQLSDTRKAVLIDLCYCVGPAGFSKFRNMHAALERHDYSSAAEEIMDSKFARQTGRRATDLERLMREDS